MAESVIKAQATSYAVGNLALPTISVPHNTVTNVTSFSLQRGVYLVLIGGMWAKNTTGLRQAGLASSATVISGGRDKNVILKAEDANTSFTATFVFTANADTTRYLNVLQTSGSTLDYTYPWYHVIKIADF